MMSSFILRFTPEALTDIVEATDYYENCKEGLGRRFRSEVKRKLLKLKENPKLYAVRYNEVRFATTDIFPYSIHFKIEENSVVIQILAVLCHYRNPDAFWKDYK